MKYCTECEVGHLRPTTKEHLIKTRLENKKEMNIENLPIEECTICGHIEYPERSQEIINTVKQIVKTEMERNIERERERSKKTSNPFISFFRQFIG